MSVNESFGRRVRLRRLYRHGDQRLLVVPLDHSVTNGPLIKSGCLNDLVCQLADNGVDAVVLHKGSLRRLDHCSFMQTSLIVHLSASTEHAPDPDFKFLVTSVEEAIRLGADAVSVHVNLGSHSEIRQLSDLAMVAEQCDRWNIPLLAMMYPRGPKIKNPHDPALVAHAVTLAADLGADIVKTLYAGSVADMSDVVRSCPIPIIVAGGPHLSDTGEVLAHVDEALRAGATGVAMGRNIFEAPNPGQMARQLVALIHQWDEAPLKRMG